MEQQAVALDDSLSLAHCVVAAIDTYNGHLDQAGTEAQRAVALDPNSASLCDFGGRTECADEAGRGPRGGGTRYASIHATATIYLSRAWLTLSWGGGRMRFLLSSVTQLFILITFGPTLFWPMTIARRATTMPHRQRRRKSKG